MIGLLSCEVSEWYLLDKFYVLSNVFSQFRNEATFYHVE